MNVQKTPFEYIDHTQITAVQSQQDLPGIFTGFFFRLFGTEKQVHNELSEITKLVSEKSFGSRRKEVANHIRLLGSKGISDLANHILRHYPSVKYGKRAKFVKEAQTEFVLAYRYARQKTTQDDIKKAMTTIGIGTSHIDSIVNNFNLGGCCEMKPAEDDNSQKLSLDALLEEQKKLANKVENFAELGNGEIVSPSYKKNISSQEKEAVQSVVERAKKVGEKFTLISEKIKNKLNEDSSKENTKITAVFDKAWKQILELENRAQ